MKKLNTVAVAMLIAGASMAQPPGRSTKCILKLAVNATHLLVSEVEGSFKDYDAKVTSTADDFAGSTIEFTAKTSIRVYG